jgi:5-methylcytosine-specific restriction protein A
MTTPRPYDTRAWRRLSARKLAAFPLCEPCWRRGYVEPAVLVHHVEHIADGGALIVHLDQLVSMCVRCHNETHAGGIKGCDLHGYPLDPNHPWNREG